VAYALRLSRRHLYNGLGAIRTTGWYCVASSSNYKTAKSIAKSRYIPLDTEYRFTYEIGHNGADQGGDARYEVLVLRDEPRGGGAEDYRYSTAHGVELEYSVMLE
jgi:hypothetical protein